MSDFQKHRKAKDIWAIDFAPDLQPGETLTGTPTVTVSRRITGGWQDATAEVLGTPSPSIVDGTKIQFVATDATGTNQAAGVYHIFASAATSGGRILVAVTELIITAEVTS